MADDSNRTRDEIEEIEEGDEGPLQVILEFEDGVTMETEVFGVFECDGKDYIALIPDDGSDDMYIYGYKEGAEGTDEFELTDIDDDEEFDRAVKQFEALMDRAESDEE